MTISKTFAKRTASTIGASAVIAGAAFVGAAGASATTQNGAVNDVATVESGSIVNAHVLANDVAPKGDSIDPSTLEIYNANNQPMGGKMTINGASVDVVNGDIRVDADSKFTGRLAPIQYSVITKKGVSMLATLDVTVKPATGTTTAPTTKPTGTPTTKPTGVPTTKPTGTSKAPAPVKTTKPVVVAPTKGGVVTHAPTTGTVGPKVQTDGPAKSNSNLPLEEGAAAVALIGGAAYGMVRTRKNN